MHRKQKKGMKNREWKNRTRYQHHNRHCTSHKRRHYAFLQQKSHKYIGSNSSMGIEKAKENDIHSEGL